MKENRDMNYRHIYHAGNFADIFKHFIVFLIMQRLQEKPAGFMALDAFAGIGLYNLKSAEAQKTAEYKTGIEPFMKAQFVDLSLKKFQEFLLPEWESGFYAGSPVQMRTQLRIQDRLYLNELHKDDFKTLSQSMAFYKNVFLSNIDAYHAVKAQIPPSEKRGFILLDPPFEKRNEFDLLIKNMELWQKKFPMGHYALWYPIKANDMSLELNAKARELAIHRSYRLEILRHKRDTKDQLNGCGMLLLNAPYTVVELLSAAKDELEIALKGQIEIELLTTD
jgi:23S rRNA (adenine2030-N6)-methyltransferase